MGTDQRQGDAMTRTGYEIGRRAGAAALFAVCLLAIGASRAAAQPPADDKPTLEIYGFGQADAIVDFKQNNPDWYDVNRPSRLPAVYHEFGNDGHFYLG